MTKFFIKLFLFYGGSLFNILSYCTLSRYSNTFQISKYNTVRRKATEDFLALTGSRPGSPSSTL